MSKVCDNKSVGVIIHNQHNEVLLIERKKFPFGFAPPAGHIDDFASPEECAKGELFEEVGLHIKSLKKMYEGRHDNKCRRQGGEYHYWYVFEAEYYGEIKTSADEVVSYKWVAPEELEQLIEKTRDYVSGRISDDDWKENPGLEPVWVDLLSLSSSN